MGWRPLQVEALEYDNENDDHDGDDDDDVMLCLSYVRILYKTCYVLFTYCICVRQNYFIYMFYYCKGRRYDHES